MYIISQIMKKQPKVVGIYRIVMKSGIDNFRSSSALDILTRLVEKGIDVIIYEPTLSCDYFNNIKVVRNLDEFKNR